MVSLDKLKVILVTDGDDAALSAVEVAAGNIGGRCISLSAGNPTQLSGKEIIKLIKKADHDPIVVMVDDKGYKGKGSGEKAMEAILADASIDVIGVVAVSSHGKECGGVKFTCSVNKEGRVIDSHVDKFGNDIGKKDVCGDTLSTLRGRKNIVIVGMGDPGKMDYNDGVIKGAPITTIALQEVMKRSGVMY